MESPTLGDEDAPYLEALEKERECLTAIQGLRESYVERLDQLSNKDWAGNGSVDGTDGGAEIADIKLRLQNMESWATACSQRIAALEEFFRKQKALDELQRAAEERQAALTNEHEKQTVNSLLRRSMNPACDWDKRHTTELITLALCPDRSNWLFRLRNRIHLLMHRH